MNGFYGTVVLAVNSQEVIKKLAALYSIMFEELVIFDSSTHYLPPRNPKAPFHSHNKSLLDFIRSQLNPIIVKLPLLRLKGFLRRFSARSGEVLRVILFKQIYLV
jgi:hypothetical protein